MRKLPFMIIILLATLLIQNNLFSDDSVLKSVAKKELMRAMDELKSKPNPPYYIAYEIFDKNSVIIHGSFGKLLKDNSNRERRLDIDMRVGSFNFDNTHIIRGNSFDFSFGEGTINLPLEDDADAISSILWLTTDRSYKKAVEKYEKALTNRAVKVKEEDSSGDFSPEKPITFSDENIDYKINKEYWRDAVRKLSALFQAEPWIYDGTVTFQGDVLTKYYISSEGTEIIQHEPYFRVFVNVVTKAEDGMSLPLYESYFAFSPDSLPQIDKISADIKNLIATLKLMRQAPLMTTFEGPALLSGEAAGVFFHEIFGHRVEGQRIKDPNNSQTFKNFLGQKVLPDFMSVDFNPTMRYLDNRPISGCYKYDDEGVEAQKVACVENGVFKNFLMSRSPIEKFPKSNGHGRKQAGYQVTTRQSNLIVRSDNSVSEEKLKDMLREEAKKVGKEFGLYFVKVQGGFTFTGRTVPNAFNVLPIIVYKIYVDGRPDELVRGVDLIGTPLTTFSNIIATGNKIGIFNGVCGAESGGVPVSASSPALLVGKIEVQKKAKSQAKPPILDAPGTY